MSRTTMNIEDTVLSELKELQQTEDRPLGDLASELLAEALTARKTKKAKPRPFRWKSWSLGLKIDLRDKETLHRILDQDLLPKP